MEANFKFEISQLVYKNAFGDVRYHVTMSCSATAQPAMPTPGSIAPDSLRLTDGSSKFLRQVH